MADRRRPGKGAAPVAAMTARLRAAIPMLRHAWFLILCLLAASLMATASVHAQERFGVVAADCGGAVHVVGDADQLPTNSDQTLPHHHGTCHGHSLTAPATSPSLLSPAVRSEAPSAADAAPLATRLIGPALEPPRA